MKTFGTFENFFNTATGKNPFPYQVRLAESPPDLPLVIDAPTGSGKTAAVILAWLWRRKFADKKIRDSTPRRLVYCLPMRVLVEQTITNANGWLKNCELLAEKPGDKDKIAVTVLMGGEEADEWDRYTSNDGIVVGTQDMLLSRALNRGYGMSRYRWPMHYALLNNDCLWVMDEVQLMGVGVETSAQLQAFREKLGCIGATRSIWMSATLDTSRLNTVDYKEKLEGLEGSKALRLDATDEARPELKKRLDAKKRINKLKFDEDLDEDGYCAEVAKKLVSVHKAGTLSLTIVNTVERARKIYLELENAISVSNRNIPHTLIHSQFRPGDREKNIELLTAKGDRIIVATQVVEAGVDASAATLITEIAPWPSLVQRFGRCNRYGEYDDNKAEILWVDIPKPQKNGRGGDKRNIYAPYDQDEIDAAKNLLQGLEDAGIKNLKKIAYAPQNMSYPVIRKKDVIELFDTTSDLIGNDLDASRYIRDTDDVDLQVYWRSMPGGKPTKAKDDYEPTRDELCSVPVWDIKRILSKRAKSITFWRWNPLKKEFDKLYKKDDAKTILPGQILLMACETGCYNQKTGWDPESGDEVIELASGEKKRCQTCGLVLGLSALNEEDSYESDALTSYVGANVTLEKHLKDTEAKASVVAKEVGLEDDMIRVLETAARWHDVGKAHKAFQDMLKGINPELGEGANTKQLWAKSKTEICVECKQRKMKQVKYGDRTHFRHELASALAYLQNAKDEQENYNLIAYLIAAHHGKVRMSLRSLPEEKKPPNGGLYARGVWDGDQLPPVDSLLPRGTTLSLSPINLGAGSWLERTLSLRDNPTIGPFRLAYYEMLLRIADWMASVEESRQ